MKKAITLISIVFSAIIAASAQDCAEADSVRLRSVADVRQWVAAQDWVRKVSTFAIGSGVRLGVDHALKHTVKEMRPDASDRHSFPSRHASWAYGLAGTVAYNLGRYSPWLVLLPHAAANGVAMQRVISRAHYPGDIMGGAGVGIGTDMLSWAVGNWIWGREYAFPCWRQSRNLLRSSLAVATGVALPLATRFGGYTLEPALDTRLRFVVPTSEKFGLAFDAGVMSAPVKSAERRPYPLNMLTLSAGAVWHGNNGPWGLSAVAQAGYRRYWQPKGISCNSGTAVGKIAIEPSVMLTRSLALGVEAGCEMSRLRLGDTARTVAAVSLGFFTRANF